MSLKARLRLGIIALVVIIVIALCALTVDAMVGAQFRDMLERVQMTALDVQNFLLLRVRDQSAAAHLSQPDNLEERMELWTGIIRHDRELSQMLEKSLAAAGGIVEILVTGDNREILASSNPSRVGTFAGQHPSFALWQNKSLASKLYEIFERRQDYEVSSQLGVRGNERALFTVRVLISSVLLRNTLRPQLRNLAIVSGAALLISLLLAAIFSNFALSPLAWVSDEIDRISRGDERRNPPRAASETREFVAVQSKLDVLSQQFRGVKADATQLRSNVDNLLENLEEAVLLFDQDRRLVLAGATAERLLGCRRSEILGHRLEEVFPPATSAGAAIEAAIRQRRPMRDRPLTAERNGGPPVRLLVNLELLDEVAGGGRGGTLVTLRDAESRTQLETQLDVSRRVTAISRLTAGVAHEIKNPLNAMAVHLEILKSKAAGLDDKTKVELDVLEREIGRLDRVVKTFLDFTRPIELKMDAVDLGELAADVSGLVSLEAGRRRVVVEAPAGANGVVVRGDRDLLRQALINIVVNGVEAMQNGGVLRIRTEGDGGQCLLEVSDDGPGIPPEVREKIFNLYFTTKPNGSGIGLAIAFRVVQLHNGKIEVVSQTGGGTSFRLVFPAWEPKTAAA